MQSRNSRQCIDNADKPLLQISSLRKRWFSVGGGLGLLLSTVLFAAGPEISIGDVSVPEGDSGKVVQQVEITRSIDSVEAIEIHYQTDSHPTDPASTPDDYEAIADDVAVIPAGETSVSVPLGIIGDTAPEGAENLILRLTSAQSLGPELTFNLQSISVWNNPHSLYVGNLNKDGLPDLVVNYYDAQHLFVNTTPQGASTAGFTKQLAHLFAQTPDFIVSDVQGDSADDFITTSSWNGGVCFRENRTATGATLVNTADPVCVNGGMSATNILRRTGSAPSSYRLMLANNTERVFTLGYIDYDPNRYPTENKFVEYGVYGMGGANIVANGNLGNNDAPADIVGLFGADKKVAVRLRVGRGYSELKQFPVGANPGPVYAQDLNGRGYEELVVINKGDNDISILENNTQQNATEPDFSLLERVTVGNSPRHAAFGDFDMDGDPDIAVAYDGGVSILLNKDGTGRFQPARHIEVVDTNLGVIVSGDFNNDGFDDLAVLGRGQNQVHVLMNTTDLNRPGPTITDNEALVTIVDDDALLTVTKQVINDDGLSKSANDFELFVNGTSVGSGVENYFKPGSYAVTESADPMYTGSFSGDCGADGKVTLAGGDIKHCVLTNDDRPNGRLTVIKQVINDGAGTKSIEDFEAFVSGEPVAWGDENYYLPGAYTVTEPPDIDYEASFGGDCAADGTVTIAAGDVKTCTITNDDIPSGLLTVTKIVVNDHGGTKQVSDFPLFIDGKPVISGEQVPISARKHVVSETSSNSYVGSIGGDCAADGSITIAAGDVKACTITNDDRPTQLAVNVIVYNNYGGTKTEDDFPPSVDGSLVPAWVYTEQLPGAHTVTVPRDLAYDMTWGGICMGSGDITLLQGGRTHCLVTFRDAPTATLTVNNVVINDDFGTKQVSDFPIYFDGVNVTPGVANTVRIGTHNVSSSGDDPAYSRTLSGDCLADGSITLAEGEEKTCNITNDDFPKPLLTVTNNVVNDEGGTKSASDFSLFVDGQPVNQGESVSYDVGDFTVTQIEDLDYATSFSGDCAANGSISLGWGEVKECIVTNDDGEPAMLTVTKVVNNDNGGNKAVSDFALFVEGVGVNSGEQNVFRAGILQITETGADGYIGTFSGDCDRRGVITLMPGDNKHCILTNDDAAPLLKVQKIVVNDDVGTKMVSDFPLFVDGNPVISGQQNAYTPGTYNVTETSNPDYVATYSGDCASDGTVILAIGDEKLCVIVNNDIRETTSGGESAPGTTATVNDINGQPVTFVSSLGVIEKLVSLPVPGEAPGGLEFPQGFFSYEITGLIAGETVVITVRLPAGSQPTEVIKCHSGVCARYENAGTQGDVVILVLTDGGMGDADGVANGVIVDPFGAASVPVTPDSSSTNQDGSNDSSSQSSDSSGKKKPWGCAMNGSGEFSFDLVILIMLASGWLVSRPWKRSRTGARA